MRVQTMQDVFALTTTNIFFAWTQINLMLLSSVPLNISLVINTTPTALNSFISPQVQNLGVVFDNSLKFDKQITVVFKIIAVQHH